MEISFRILEQRDIDQIIEFEKAILVNQGVSEDDIMIQSWSAKWRSEQLNHYTQQGWSMVCYEVEIDSLGNKIEKSLMGYFMAQPLLYFDGMIQSLWVEQVNAKKSEILNSLLDIAWKMTRDKNFQRIYFSGLSPEIIGQISSKSSKWNLSVQIINHPKMS